MLSEDPRLGILAPLAHGVLLHAELEILVDTGDA